ncbi:MAG TPA: class I adenylate-forming enzyme family protein [Ramlibacter sp.]|nr:class I adenylate-forming enzyme family protein [Ramlibacter sp.]
MKAPAPPPFRTIAGLVHEHATQRPRQAAMIHGDRRVTWEQVDAMMDRVAATLQRDGVQPRQSIAIAGANSLEYLALFLGALRAGVAVAPLPTGATTAQLATMVADSGARHFFVDATVPAFASPARRIFMDASGSPSIEAWLLPHGAKPKRVDVKPEWPFNIIYSSGTTGTPKGIVQPHGMRWIHVARGRAYGYAPDTVSVIATSLCSNTTLTCVFPTVAQGGCVVLGRPKFDARAYLELAEQVRATHTMLVPVQYQRIMDLPEFDGFDLESFVNKFCTSAPFHAELKADILQRWTGGLVEFYGMTEGGGTCILEAHNYPDKLHTVGKPAEGHDIRVIDEDGKELPAGAIGEVVGRSPAMMTAYNNQPEKTREAEWYDRKGQRFIRTGDVGRFDDEGFLTLMDRRKDMVISGGFNVYPSDIEAILRAHEKVADAAVVGIASKEWGETPVAFVVVREDAPSVEQLREWVNAQVGKTQRLSGIRYVDELPRSEIGKVLKRQLRESW